MRQTCPRTPGWRLELNRRGLMFYRSHLPLHRRLCRIAKDCLHSSRTPRWKARCAPQSSLQARQHQHHCLPLCDYNKFAPTRSLFARVLFNTYFLRDNKTPTLKSINNTPSSKCRTSITHVATRSQDHSPTPRRIGLMSSSTASTTPHAIPMITSSTDMSSSQRLC